MKGALKTASAGLVLGAAALIAGGIAGCSANQSQPNNNLSLNGSTPTAPYQAEQENPQPMPASAIQPPPKQPLNNRYPPTYVPSNVTTNGGMYPATAPAQP